MFFTDSFKYPIVIPKEHNVTKLIIALKLIALRGAVRLIQCDQGTNFVGAKNEFKTRA